MYSYFLPDTNVLIGVLNGLATDVAFMEDMDNKGFTPVVCSVTAAEVYAGLHTEREKQIAENLFGGCVKMDISVAVGIEAGILKQKHFKERKRHMLPDLLIASLCMSKQIPLATHNVSDFPQKGLKILKV